MISPDSLVATLEINIDPLIHLGPIEIAWHGLMSAVGIGVGLEIAVRYARWKQLDPNPIYSMSLWMVVAGVIGARVLFLAENHAGDLLTPSMWLGVQGFSIYGGMIGAGLAAVVFLMHRRLDMRYMDALAAGFPMGMAIGRIGDLIYGEHFGAPSSLPWAIKYVHPGAGVPGPDVAYQPGGLYEIVLALMIAVVIWSLRNRFRRSGELLWTVVGLYGLGRSLMFFYRSDSEPLALGLDVSQWISLALVGGSLLGLWVARHPEVRKRIAAAIGSALLVGAGLTSLAGCSSGRTGEGASPGDPLSVSAVPSRTALEPHSETYSRFGGDLC